ncbi:MULTISPECIES: thermonuclease family protein [Salinibaculum]|uniref:thermonuclease family protein n=1 Tax=Salinibaculum TaxID=2732368 RepID=UPI0030D0EE7F
MTQTTRRFFLVMLVVLAGCSVNVTETGPTATGTASSGVGAGDATTSPAFEPAERIPVRVTDVVDGDTVDVVLPDGSEETVRLLGVDTPEVHTETTPPEFEGVPDSEAGRACLREAGQNASEYLRGHLSGEDATLLVDPVSDRRGGYGRLLAYVSHDGRNLNYALVGSGHARVYDSQFALRTAFYDAEVDAREAGRGVWRCRSPV